MTGTARDIWSAARGGSGWIDRQPMIAQLDRQLLRGAAVRYGVERCRQEVRLGELQAPGAGGTVNYQSMRVVAPEAHHPVNRPVEERDRPWSVHDVNAHSVTH